MIEEESVTKMRRKNYKKILHWGIKRGFLLIWGDVTHSRIGKHNFESVNYVKSEYQYENH